MQNPDAPTLGEKSGLVDPTAAALGFVVACFVGIFFGLQPAHQAARLDPIAALRSA